MSNIYIIMRQFDCRHPSIYHEISQTSAETDCDEHKLGNNSFCPIEAEYQMQFNDS